jgi:hypothetical protein
MMHYPENEVLEKPAAVIDVKKHNGNLMLLHWNGRFGNRMFTYAFLRHYAEAFNLKILLPSEWEGSVLFGDQVHEIIGDEELRLYLNQTMFPYDNLDARLSAVENYGRRTGEKYRYMNPDLPADYGLINVCIDSLCCYSSHIFEKYSREKMIDEYFTFSEALVRSDLYRRMEDRQGTYVAAHLRRDDIANASNHTNKGYSVLSRASYIRAFKKFGYDPDKVIWVTDDRTGKYGIPAATDPRGWRYPEGSERISGIFYSWLPDFLKLMFAGALFRANSSFSWWAGFFSRGSVFAPRLHKRQLYHQTLCAIDVEFEAGNHPHWICVQGLDPCDDIFIN